MMQDLLVTALAIGAAAAVVWRVVRSGRSGASAQTPSCPSCPGHVKAKPRRGGKGVVLPPDARIV